MDWVRGTLSLSFFLSLSLSLYLHLSPSLHLPSYAPPLLSLITKASWNHSVYWRVFTLNDTCIMLAFITHQISADVNTDLALGSTLRVILRTRSR